MIASGVPPLDERLGGAIAGRLHVISGGPGTGKSTAGLQFLHEGLRQGGTVSLLTGDRTDDLRSHAAHLAIDLAAPLRTGRLVVLRYRSACSALLQHAAVPEQMLDDLRRLLRPARPARIVVDPVGPLLAAAPHGDSALAAMADLFEEMGSTVLMTISGDATAGRGAGYDFRADPLIERAAAVLHLSRHIDDGAAPAGRHRAMEPSYRLHVVRVRRPVRSMASVAYRIEAGRGLVSVRAGRAAGDAVEPIGLRHSLRSELR